MKLVSPFQRGTMWMCRCSAMPAPAHFAEVDADVEAVGFHHLRERVLAAAGELHQIGQFLVGQTVQVGRLLVGHDHRWPPV